MTEADAYLPGHGDLRYAVEHYDLELRYKPHGNHLDARATLRVRALTELPELLLDLHGLTVTSLHVDGAEVARWSHRSSRLRVRLRHAVDAGTGLVVRVGYRGNPHTMHGPDGAAGWEELTDGVLVAAQPHGAPTWFPCNDRMADKATYRIAVTTEPGFRVVSNGEPHPERRVGRLVEWVHQQDRPMATYLATLQIGPYVAERQEAVTPLWLMAPPQRMARAREVFADQPRMLEVFGEHFGPYPFERYSVVVTNDPLEIPLESTTLATFGTNHLSRSWEAQRLVAHELSHQWFGNAVTAATLADIWLHEGFACYAEWLWSEATGRTTADKEARRHHTALRRLAQDLVLTDPGPRHTFDDRVYKRGALTLHAVRLTLGDDAFFALLRTWVAEHRDGVVTTADFAEAVRQTGADLADLLEAWLRRPALPDLPAPPVAPRGPLRRAQAAVSRRLPG